MGIGIKAVNAVANSKLFKKLNQPSIAGAASGIALASTMSKDIVATYYYVTQSAKNEKIPPEKRSFVAALDLGNGIMNVIGALAIGLPMKGWMEKLFDSKIEKKYFSTEVAEKTMQNRQLVMMHISYIFYLKIIYFISIQIKPPMLWACLTMEY